jgi:hypothetical protein
MSTTQEEHIEKQSMKQRLLSEEMIGFWKRVTIATPIQILIIFIVSMLVAALAIGANWDIAPRLQNIDVVIVNKDNDAIGNFVQNALTNITLFKWLVGNEITDARSYVQDGYAWIAVYIAPNTTRNFRASILAQNSTLVPVQYIFDHARSFQGHAVLTTIMDNTLRTLSTVYAQKVLPNQIPSNTSFAAVNLDVRVNPIPAVPAALNPLPIFGPDFTSGIFICFMVLLAFTIEAVCVAIWSPLETKVNGLAVHTIRALTLLATTFLASLGITLMLLAFGPVFKYGFGTAWMWFWLVLYAEVMMLGVIGILFRKATGFIIPIYIILLNVSSQAILPYELSPGFYYIGLAFPVSHGIWGARTVISGGYNRIGINIGVLFAWIVGSLLVIFIKIEIDKKVRERRAIRKQKRAEAKELKQAKSIEEANIKASLPLTDEPGKV